VLGKSAPSTPSPQRNSKPVLAGREIAVVDEWMALEAVDRVEITTLYENLVDHKGITRAEKGQSAPHGSARSGV
jgi:hypothetical protein